jgi:hypothetical protein
MSKESFWKKAQNKLCPPDKQPPSFWTTMIIVILVGGLVAWLFGLPWQADIGVTFFLVLLAIGGQQLGKLSLKKYHYIRANPTQKAMSPWGIFWSVVLLAIIAVAVQIPWALSERYPSWPEWSWVIPYFVFFIALIVIGIIYLYKRSKKMRVPYNRQDKIWTILTFIEIVLFINISLWFVVWMYVDIPWWLKLIILLCISLSSILGSVYPYKRLRKTLEKQPQIEQDTPITRAKG